MHVLSNFPEIKTIRYLSLIGSQTKPLKIAMYIHVQLLAK